MEFEESLVYTEKSWFFWGEGHEQQQQQKCLGLLCYGH